ncbi:hypothetical protein GDI2357 [Gluconacetobacter diazotrophicus PA1 5]|uniref:Uncharacterized protein n=1 Tax=Gluconacetobacter diazotrophicus (strain ATCC 49037 / DSM 5601 / CCUG 37298 / CIP 103539 / LMG 7603 / PAl5) TaxID=272568 RepID=A9HMF1_GLUDA|nr:hypothetical protein GDI2357 [Gluconacetobacter diazotrophicus PA1 5]
MKQPPIPAFRAGVRLSRLACAMRFSIAPVVSCLVRRHA